MAWSKEAFKEKLDSEHKFPGLYIFKFIVPIDKKPELLGILPQGEMSERLSKNNNYTSVTVKAKVNNSDEVIMVYESAYSISGIIAL